MGPVSVMVPQPLPVLDGVAPWARLVDEHAAARLWTGTSGRADPYAAFAYAAGLGHRQSCGLAVALTPGTGPRDAAVRAATLSVTTGRPFCLGLGPGGVAHQRAVLGRPYPRPVEACVEYLRRTREELAALAARSPAGAGSVELGLGVLRPRMAAAAGEHAHFAVTWMCPPAHLASTLVPQVRAGERRTGNTCRVVAMVPVALRHRGRTALEVVAAACGTHLSAPHYRRALAPAGVELDGPPATDADAARLLDTDLLVVDAERAAEVVGRYRAAGADEVVLNPLGSARLAGDAAAVEDTGRVLRALTAAPTAGQPERR